MHEIRLTERDDETPPPAVAAVAEKRERKQK
jgi:hypothetical protein